MTKRPSFRSRPAYRFDDQQFRIMAAVPIVALLLIVAGAVSWASADETNDPAGVTPQEVDALIAKVKPGDRFPPPETLKDLRGAALLVAALKKDPRDPWPHFLNLSFTANQRTARSLDPAERKQAFADLLVQLKEARRVIEADTKPRDELTQSSMLRLDQNINVASIEAGVDFDQVKRSAEAMLAGNTDAESWNYGNVIFSAHTILGRVALREGRVDDAKQHLIESGKTPGSPQLNSFGPDFILAGELVEAGERTAVVEFLDLVAEFWATPQKLDAKVPSYREQKARNREQLEKWKQEILNGKIPRSGPDRTQGWPG